jgi:hypothetical protein
MKKSILFLFVGVPAIALMGMAVFGTLLYDFILSSCIFLLVLGVFLYWGFFAYEEDEGWTSRLFSPFYKSSLTPFNRFIRLIKNYSHGIFWSVCIALVFSPIILIAWGVIEASIVFYEYIIVAAPGGKVTVIGTVIIMILSLAAFTVRLYFRFFFGVTEASVGAFIVAYRLSNNTISGNPIDTNFILAILLAGVFLMVRGFDNMHQGWLHDNVLVFLRNKKKHRNKSKNPSSVESDNTQELKADT